MAGSGRRSRQHTVDGFNQRTIETHRSRFHRARDEPQRRVSSTTVTTTCGWGCYKLISDRGMGHDANGDGGQQQPQRRSGRQRHRVNCRPGPTWAGLTHGPPQHRHAHADFIYFPASVANKVRQQEQVKGGGDSKVLAANRSRARAHTGAPGGACNVTTNSTLHPQLGRQRPSLSVVWQAEVGTCRPRSARHACARTRARSSP